MTVRLLSSILITLNFQEENYLNIIHRAYALIKTAFLIMHYASSGMQLPVSIFAKMLCYIHKTGTVYNSGNNTLHWKNRHNNRNNWKIVRASP